MESGKHYKIKVTPSVLLSDEGVHDLDLKTRKCKFRYESDGLKYFQQYSEALCKYECALQKSQEICGCTPWNYPQLGPVRRVCDQYENNCFRYHYALLVYRMAYADDSP